VTITALITGKLLADPEQRIGNSGKPFTTAKLIAATDDESALVSVIAFGSVAEQLVALRKGDTAALVGRTKLTAWLKDGEPKAGISVVADQLLSVYHLRRKRLAVAGDDEGQRS
jgi:single-stranded DNA-binding protein